MDRVGRQSLHQVLKVSDRASGVMDELSTSFVGGADRRVKLDPLSVSVCVVIGRVWVWVVDVAQDAAWFAAIKIEMQNKDFSEDAVRGKRRTTTSVEVEAEVTRPSFHTSSHVFCRQ